ncbi:unnamed protein product [Cylicocyclus nassatus]|uniref:Major sperm protein n=1 Tax=Cylicocyclus nassatus TaxID=53992 RepID=A0AA36M9U5_CYLNA|nr:unnamed protein product [Cylicocyclus nassatus]
MISILYTSPKTQQTKIVLYEQISTPVVFLDQTLLVFDIEQSKNASQTINISRVPKAGLVSFRFQTNAPTRYIVSPNCGVLENDKPVPIRIELVENRYNPQHKLIVQAISIPTKEQWKTIWEDPKIEEPGAFQTIWIELGTTLMSLEQTLNLADPSESKGVSVVQLLNASNTKGAGRVKELQDLKAMLRADNETLQKNVEQTKNLKNVIEKQLKERTAEAKELQEKEEKLTAEQDRLNADLARDESELRILKERRGDNCKIIPSFLKGLSTDARKEYYGILRKANETIAQQKQQILEWAGKHNVTDKVKKFDEDLKKHQMEVKKNVTDVLSALPKIHEQFLKIVEDENQSHNQMRHKIEELARNHTKEFDALMYISTHLHVHHRRHHKRHVKKHSKKHAKHYK